MRYVRLILMVAVIGGMSSVGAFAQRGGNDNRPPKEDQKVKERDKTPPSNSNNSNRRHP